MKFGIKVENGEYSANPKFVVVFPLYPTTPYANLSNIGPTLLGVKNGEQSFIRDFDGNLIFMKVGVEVNSWNQSLNSMCFIHQP